MQKTINFLKIIILLIVGFYMIFSTMLLISYKNIVYQTISSIDYVYATETGQDPTLADTWLVDKYCSNKVGLNLAYPEMKDKCEELEK